MKYDGDGKQVRIQTVAEVYDPELGETTTKTTIRYEVRSSVLGKVITELDENGQKTRGFVYSGDGSVMAVQQKSGATENVTWEHIDAIDSSYRVTNSTGTVVSGKAAELDPL